MSRNANPLTSFTLLEDRLTALLTRIDAAVGVLTEQAAREAALGAQGVDEAAGNATSAALEQMRQLAEIIERQENGSRESEPSSTEWLTPLQQQLERIEQRVEELSRPANSPATFS